VKGFVKGAKGFSDHR